MRVRVRPSLCVLALWLLLGMSCLEVAKAVKFALVSPRNNTLSSSIVSFKARLSYRDTEHTYAAPPPASGTDRITNHSSSSPPPPPPPLHICFRVLDLNLDNCTLIPPLQGSIKANLGISSISTQNVVEAVLCRRKRVRKKRWSIQEGDQGSPILTLSATAVSKGSADDKIDIVPIESMDECLASVVEDSLSIHLRSPSFNNDLPALLLSGSGDTVAAAAGGGAESSPVGAMPVGLLISTLDPSSSGRHREDQLALQASLFSYLLSMSNDVYIIVPRPSVCDSLSALSIICCALSSPELCIPVVADLAIFYVAAEHKEEGDRREEQVLRTPLEAFQMPLLAALVRVRGQTLIISPKHPINTYNSSTSAHGSVPELNDDSTVNRDLSENFDIEQLKRSFQEQRVFLQAQLPARLYQSLHSFTPIAFPANDDSVPDESYVLKEKSHFVACRLHSLSPDFVPSGAREPSHLLSSPSSPYSSSLPFSVPSTATFSFNNGINLATLSNVCLANNKKEFYLVKDHSSNHILSAELRAILKQSSSGFYPFDSTGGWFFSEVTAAELLSISSAAGADTDADVIQEVSFYPGLSAFSSPAFAPQMVHTAQTVFPLLQAAMHPELYPWINHLERLMFPTVSRFADKWVLGLISMLTSIANSAHSPAQPTVWPNIYLKEDMATAARSSLLCFETVVVLGHIDLSSPFISSPLEASAFQAHLLASIPQTPAPALAAHSHNSGSDRARNSDKSRSSGIRITLALRRAGRKLLNLDEVMVRLRDAALARDGTSVLDMEWLHTHVVDMELLSVQTQLQVMRDTDIFISAHDAGLLNLIFMQPHSAIIEIFTAPWFEVTYQCTALAMDLHYFVLPQTRIRNSFFCEPYAEECLDSIAFRCCVVVLMLFYVLVCLRIQENLVFCKILNKRSDMRCLGLRACSVRVDVDALEVQLYQAIQAVQIKKFRLYATRLEKGASDLQQPQKDYSYAPYVLL